jgi:hypothetical protein
MPGSVVAGILLYGNAGEEDCRCWSGARETAKIYRDNEGSLRCEHLLPDLDATGLLVQTADLDAGFMAMIVTSERAAFRMSFPPKRPGNPGGFAFLGMGSDELMREPGQRSTKAAALGKRLINGIEFEGKLTTTTVEGDHIITGTEERWFSKELGLFGLRVTSALGMTTTTRVENLIRGDPDPSLFKIPADYAVHELAEPPQN